VRGWLLGLVVSSACVLVGTAPPSAAAPRVDGGAPQLILHSTDLGPVAASNRMEITFWLKPRDTQGLDNMLAKQHAGTAQYLSQGQIDARGRRR
jgi:hypothetical protein